MARSKPDPFHDFADDAEAPLASCRAKMCAVHHLLESRDNPGAEIMDAVRALVAETWGSLDELTKKHVAAFDAARGERL